MRYCNPTLEVLYRADSQPQSRCDWLKRETNDRTRRNKKISAGVGGGIPDKRYFGKRRRTYHKNPLRTKTPQLSLLYSTGGEDRMATDTKNCLRQKSRGEELPRIGSLPPDGGALSSAYSKVFFIRWTTSPSTWWGWGIVYIVYHIPPYPAGISSYCILYDTPLVQYTVPQTLRYTTPLY